MYKALVHPHMLYCISTWGACSLTTLKPLIVLQNKIVRCIAATHRMSSAPPLYYSLGIFPLRNIFKYSVCCYVNKSMEQDRTEFSLISNERHQLRSTNQQLLFVPRTHSTHSRQCIKFIGPRTFNSLPIEIRAISDFVSFKCVLKRHILCLP